MADIAKKTEAEAQAAEKALNVAQKKLKDSTKAAKGTLLGDVLLAKVVADNELKKIEAANNEALLKQSAERTSDTEFLEQYHAYMTFYQMSWQSFMDAVERTGTGVGSVQLVLCDPPYEVSFVNSANRTGLARMFDKVVHCVIPFN